MIGWQCTMDGVHFAVGGELRRDRRLLLLHQCGPAVRAGVAHRQLRRHRLERDNRRYRLSPHRTGPAHRRRHRLLAAGKGRPRPPIAARRSSLKTTCGLARTRPSSKASASGGGFIEPGALVTRDVSAGARVLGNPAVVVGRVECMTADRRLPWDWYRGTSRRMSTSTRRRTSRRPSASTSIAASGPTASDRRGRLDLSGHDVRRRAAGPRQRGRLCAGPRRAHHLRRGDHHWRLRPDLLERRPHGHLPRAARPEARRAPVRRVPDTDAAPLDPSEPARPVRIGRNVWIGFDSCVLPGVTIGEGAIVGARSVVAADVPPYTIVAGNPARVDSPAGPRGDGAWPVSPAAGQDHRLRHPVLVSARRRDLPVPALPDWPAAARLRPVLRRRLGALGLRSAH